MLNGRFTVDLAFEHSLQLKSFIVSFLILKPFDRNNVARDLRYLGEPFLGAPF